MHQSMTPMHVLLVEDDEDDVLLTREAFQESQLAVQLHVVNDGVQAMQFLRQQPPYTDARRPNLILLDLNLPRKDGREVLDELKHDPDLAQIPVAVLTTSAAEEDILCVYRLHANCYVRKPITMEQFVKVVREISSFWFTTVELPSK